MVPTIFIIFGITGDLSGRKLLPALLNLYVNKRLPPKFAIVGFSRRSFSREEFRQYIREHMKIKPGEYHGEDIKHFLDHMYYEQGFFDNPSSYSGLSLRLESIDDGFRQCSNKLFHLAVAPHFYETILQNLSNSGLTIPCGGNEGWTRVLVEKPFGRDIETAKKLDKKLSELFEESQIFRIDHYLAKEAMQNILAFRFSNTLFEPLWSAKHIDTVHIKLLEANTVEGRGDFYDGLGALKDVGQNHILQMLSLIAMDQPENFSAEAIRKERAKLLSKLEPMSPKKLPKATTRSQYEGYINEKGVKQGSQTETYFCIETHIDSARWRNVPFYLESGKALAENKAEIDIYFKNDKEGDRDDDPENQNILTFRIQPDEGIKIRFFVKTPGFDMKVEPKTMKFKYADFQSFQSLPDAYERVLFDAITGDQTLFTSTEEVMHAWKYITSVLESWKSVPLTSYKKGE